MDDHNTFTLSQGLNFGHSQNEDNILLNYMDQKMESLRNGERANNSYNRSIIKIPISVINTPFEKPNQELTAYISYSGNNSSSGSNPTVPNICMHR